MVKVDFDIDGETSDSRKRGEEMESIPLSSQLPSARSLNLRGSPLAAMVLRVRRGGVVELSRCRAVAAERGRFEIGPGINQDRRRGEWVNAGQVSYLLVNSPKLVDSKVRFRSDVSASLLAKQDRRLSTGLSKLCYRCRT
jgi:hypothetical protein